MTHPLSKAAVEAAAKACRDNERGNGNWYEMTEAALSAAFEQTRVEGNAKAGFGWEIPEGWEADTYKKRDVTDFPVLIIKEAKP